MYIKNYSCFLNETLWFAELLNNYTILNEIPIGKGKEGLIYELEDNKVLKKFFIDYEIDTIRENILYIKDNNIKSIVKIIDIIDNQNDFYGVICEKLYKINSKDYIDLCNVLTKFFIKNANNDELHKNIKLKKLSWNDIDRKSDNLILATYFFTADNYFNKIYDETFFNLSSNEQIMLDKLIKVFKDLKTNKLFFWDMDDNNFMYDKNDNLIINDIGVHFVIFQ